MITRVTQGARRGRLRRSMLVRACTPLTKSEEKERLLAVYSWSKRGFKLSGSIAVQFAMLKLIVTGLSTTTTNALFA